jgi:serine/threonine-protein kinase
MARRDLLIGTELGGYRIESLIGRGGMGAVYLAEQVALGRKVAVKVLPPELADSADFRHRFERESRVAASLDHPNVVPIYESGEIDGVLFIAMRLVGGTDLATLLAREGPMSPERGASLVRQVGSALDAAHAKGLVHRDVKPGNILVVSATDEDDHVYLSDFGLTRLTSSDSALTRSGTFMGTVAYAAPEQFQGQPADAGSDLYSLGCVAFECVTGQRPFPQEQEAAVMFAHLQEEPPRASERRPGIPSELDPVLAKAMAKRPEDRYPTGKALGSAMRAAVTESPEAVASAPPVADSTPPADSTPSGPGSEQPSGGVTSIPPPAPPSPPGSTTPPRRVSRRWTGIAAAATAVAVVAGVVVVTRQGGSTPRGSPTPSAPTSVASGLPSGGPSASTPPTANASGAPPGLPIDVNTVFRIDPDTGSVVGSYPVGANPQALVVSGNSVWVINQDDVTISKIDMSTGHVTTRGGIADPCGLSPAQGGGVWVDDCSEGQVQLVDPNSFEVVQRIHVSQPAGVVTTHGSVWVLGYRGVGTPSVLFKFTPSGRLEAKIKVSPGAAAATVADDGSIWGNGFGDGTIWRVDPSTDAVTFVDGWTGPELVVADGQVLWVDDSQLKSVTEYDTVTGQTVGVVQGHHGALAVTPTTLWIQDSGPDTLTEVDKAGTQILAEYQLGYSSDMGYGDGSLWISAGTD